MSNNVIKGVGYCYDDLQIIPKFTKIESRLAVDISTVLYSRRNPFTIKLAIPILAASMDTICNGKMALAIAEAGGMGVIHRYQSVEDRVKEIEKVGNNYPVGVSIGLSDTIVDILSYIKAGACLINIDVANSFSNKVLNYTKFLLDNTYIKRSEIVLMVGNVCTGEAASTLIHAGVDIIKIGTGSGSICSTRLVTGIGVPSMTAIEQSRQAIENFPKEIYEDNKWKSVNSELATIIADGGIRTSGDIAKSIGIGADACMIGSLLAGCKETPGLFVDDNGACCKQYRGMASIDSQVDWRGSLKEGTAAEGISVKVPYRDISAKDIVKELAGGLRSSLTFVGASNLKEFYQNVDFIQVTNMGLMEAQTHINFRK